MRACLTLDIRPLPAVYRHDSVHPVDRQGHTSPRPASRAGARYRIAVSHPNASPLLVLASVPTDKRLSFIGE